MNHSKILSLEVVRAGAGRETGGEARWEATADLVIVGSGVAGLTAAAEARARGLRVLVVTKAGISEGSTRLAQGGVAVVLPDQCDPGDTVAAHAADTVTAGAGMCDEDAVAAIVRAGPVAITKLVASGATFDGAAGGRFARTREGGHRAFRILRAGGDATGVEIERALVDAARGSGLPVLEHHVVVDAVHTASGAVGGILVLDQDGVLGLVRAPAVLLATGGLGQLYQATSNPTVATGDGIALALRAGAMVSDLEFVQFHPTVLYTGKDARGQCPLVTEAVRGEGAILIDALGKRVMTGVHPLEDLAPRDVVSAAITRHMASAPGGVDDHVFLDATGLGADEFRTRFPTVYASCREIGIDPGVDPIPVTPACHFSCGGISTTIEGRTTVPGLYAAGEAARTGLHGANRLASNSLLEGLVVGGQVAAAVAEDLATGQIQRGAQLEGLTLPALPMVDRELLQRTMSRYAAIGRDEAGLEQALSTVEGAAVCRRADSVDRVEDAALTLVAGALLTLALQRRESRGCHVRNDYPMRESDLRATSQHVRLDVSGRLILVQPAVLTGVA